MSSIIHIYGMLRIILKESNTKKYVPHRLRNYLHYLRINHMKIL